LPTSAQFIRLLEGRLSEHLKIFGFSQKFEFTNNFQVSSIRGSIEITSQECMINHDNNYI